MAIEPPGVSWLFTGGFLAAAAIAGAALGAWNSTGRFPVDRIEDVVLDWRFLLAGPLPAPADVVL